VLFIFTPVFLCPFGSLSPDFPFANYGPKQQPYFQPKGALLPKGSKVLEKGKDKES
jgi:hypothetical protein